MMRPLNDDIINDASQYDDYYLHGLENKAIRYYYYLNQGLSILNQFRNLFLGIVALYIALKLDNPLYMVVMFVASVTGLTIIGYYNVHTMNRVMEWIGMRFSTHYSIRQFNYNQGQYDLLKEIRDIVKK